MKYAMTILTVSVICFNLQAAQILSYKSMDEVKKLVEVKTSEVGATDILVVFDFDNTLMKMSQDLGSDQWYNWQNELIKNKDFKLAVAKNRSDLFAITHKLFYLSSMKSVEPTTAQTVQLIQNLKVKTFVMTSRGDGLEQDVKEELESLDLDFSSSSIGPKGGFLEPLVPTGLDKPRQITFRNGLLLGSGQDKGVLLKYILDLTKTQFKVIIFVDDTLKNIENVNKAYADAEGVYAIHYTHEKEAVEKFNKNPQKAVRDWKKIKPVLNKTFGLF
jgi:predicted HAD superfamily phosphohydrolase YqeG